MDRALATYAAGFLGLAVMLGAFGAHGLKDILDAYSTGIYEKAVFYHFLHALGALFIATLPAIGGLEPEAARRIGVLMLLGVLIFSGSLYVLAITGAKWLGMITPLGGTAFIGAWFMLAYKIAPAKIDPSKIDRG